MQAAGALAQIERGDGFGSLLTALQSENRVLAMVACKQLIHFVPLHGDELDVYQGYRLALAHGEQAVRGEALAQLDEIDTNQAKALLAQQ